VAIEKGAQGLRLQRGQLAPGDRRRDGAVGHDGILGIVDRRHLEIDGTILGSGLQAIEDQADGPQVAVQSLVDRPAHQRIGLAFEDGPADDRSPIA